MAKATAISLTPVHIQVCAGLQVGTAWATQLTGLGCQTHPKAALKRGYSRCCDRCLKTCLKKRLCRHRILNKAQAASNDRNNDTQRESREVALLVVWKLLVLFENVGNEVPFSSRLIML